jgi:uncharacterized membrane protein YcgQ (UPF0703/DUF1980 family)
MKRNVMLTVLLSAIGLVQFTGCEGKEKIAAVQKNQAGTQSVNLPAAVPLYAPETPAADTVTDLFDAKVIKKQPSPAAGDIVEIREKMFIAQTNDVYLNPEDYLGKTIKLEGLFKRDQYTGSDTVYCFVLRYGPGCCGSDGNAGFEVAWDTSDSKSPVDSQYPEEDDWVEAMGVLSTYEEDGYPYLYLALSSLRIKEELGAEFVAQ